MLRQLEQPLHGVDRHVDHRAGRDVVDDDGDADRVVDGLVVLVEPLLGRLVVIGRHHQDRVGAGLFGMAGELDRLLGRVRARARDHRHASLGHLDAPFHDLLVLVVAQGRALAGGADRHQAIGSLGDLPLDQIAKGLLIQRAVLEGGEKRRERSPEARLGGHVRILVCRGDRLRRNALLGPAILYHAGGDWLLLLEAHRPGRRWTDRHSRSRPRSRGGTNHTF